MIMFDIHAFPRRSLGFEPTLCVVQHDQLLSASPEFPKAAIK
jgi:hypothetical protein